MNSANMPPHVEVSFRKVCVCACVCEKVIYTDLCVMVSYGVEGHSTVHAKCDLIYGSGTGEWVEWEWTGCPGIELSFLIILNHVDLILFCFLLNRLLVMNRGQMWL